MLSQATENTVAGPNVTHGPLIAQPCLIFKNHTNNNCRSLENYLPIPYFLKYCYCWKTLSRHGVWRCDSPQTGCALGIALICKQCEQAIIEHLDKAGALSLLQYPQGYWD